MFSAPHPTMTGRSTSSSALACLRPKIVNQMPCATLTESITCTGPPKAAAPQIAQVQSSLYKPTQKTLTQTQTWQMSKWCPMYKQCPMYKKYHCLKGSTTWPSQGIILCARKRCLWLKPQLVNSYLCLSHHLYVLYLIYRLLTMCQHIYPMGGATLFKLGLRFPIWLESWTQD